MPLPTACILFLTLPGLAAEPSVPPAEPAAVRSPARTPQLRTPATFFEPTAQGFSEQVAMLVDQSRVDYMPTTVLSPSGYGTYMYAKVGAGVAFTEQFQFDNVPLARLGIRDQVQDIEFQGQVLEDIVFLDIVDETTALTFDVPIGPIIGGGVGLDISLGRQFLGNRLRPRVEAEYMFHPVRISSPRGSVTFREAERDEFGGIIVFPGPPPQSLLGEPVTERIGFRSGDVELHMFSANFILTYEVYTRLRPYLGLGGGLTYARANAANLRDNDLGFHLQGLGGVIFSITEDFELDVGLRYTTVDLDLFGSGIDINSISATLMLNIRL